MVFISGISLIASFQTYGGAMWRDRTMLLMNNGPTCPTASHTHCTRAASLPSESFGQVLDQQASIQQQLSGELEAPLGLFSTG